MMAKLVPITPEIFPLLYDAFLHDDDPMTDRAGWERVFLYGWDHGGDGAGYALLHEGRAVGMMATAWSERRVRGERRRFCNVHTWWVHPDHRGHSITMLRPLIAMRGVTVTHFTPGDRVRSLFRRLGFQDLDATVKLLLPLGGDGDAVTFGHCDESGPARDHAPYGVHRARIDGLDVLYIPVDRYRFRYCHILHWNDDELFGRHEEAVRTALMRRHGVRVVAVDRRRLRAHAPRRALDFWAPAHALFRPEPGVEAADVDALYSDVAMLRLATLPHVTHELAKIVRRRLPNYVEEAA